MIVPKSEAYELYCPLKYISQIKNPFCVHDSCMAWRYLDIKNEHKERFGYCGLVGKPPEEDVKINFRFENF